MPAERRIITRNVLPLPRSVLPPPCGQECRIGRRGGRGGQEINICRNCSARQRAFKQSRPPSPSRLHYLPGLPRAPKGLQTIAAAAAIAVTTSLTTYQVCRDRRAASIRVCGFPRTFNLHFLSARGGIIELCKLGVILQSYDKSKIVAARFACPKCLIFASSVTLAKEVARVFPIHLSLESWMWIGILTAC